MKPCMSIMISTMAERFSIQPAPLLDIGPPRVGRPKPPVASSAISSTHAARKKGEPIKDAGENSSVS